MVFIEDFSLFQRLKFQYKMFLVGVKMCCGNCASMEKKYKSS